METATKEYIVIEESAGYNSITTKMINYMDTTEIYNF